MKDVKILLKEAREAIKNKNYDLTLKLTKSILKEDKCNYMALLFLGLSLQEVGPVEQASKAFEKAIKLNPKNPLAWNGLINYYEKLDNEESKSKLVELYISALDVETNPKKIVEYSEKLCGLYEKGDIIKITNIVFKCVCKAEDNAVQVFEVLAKLYKNLKDVSKDLQPIFEECFYKLIGLREYRTIEYYSSYLNLLYQQNKYNELVESAEEMHKVYENNTVPLIWICKIYNQLFVEQSTLINNLEDKVKYFYQVLLNLEPKNAIGIFSKSIQIFQDNNLPVSKELLNEVCTLRPGLVHAWVLLTKVCLKLYLHKEALQAFSSAYKLLNTGKYNNIILQKDLESLQIQILSRTLNKDDWNQAVNIFKCIKDDNLRKDNLPYIITVFINLQEYNQAELLITEMKNINDQKSRYLKSLLLKKQQKYEESLKLLQTNPPDDSEWWLLIGLIYWKMEDYKNSLVPFLKAAKCDPYNYNSFHFLGKYYQIIEDFDKARRCYEKALSLNQNSQEIATELSKIYCIIKNFKAAQNLLLNLTGGPINENNSWAWLQLGLIYLEQEDYSKAIEKLQFVVRIEKENTYYWQCLADAYYARGSYISALKCYEKSLEFTDNTLYPSLQLANIKKTLGLFDEAKIEFMNIVVKNEYYIPALKGLAETSLYQAKDCFRDQRLGTSRDHAQTALKNLTVAIDQKNNFSCLWKLIGDTCLFVTNLPPKYCCLFVTEKLIQGKTLLEKEDMFTFAASCYCKAISLTEDNLLIWHDLANSYLKHGLSTEDPEKRKVLLSYAISAAKHAANSNPKYWQHWNLLGNITMAEDPPNFALAQHYFIKAVTVENNNPVSWGNLGILYFRKGDIQLSNKAFAQGQRSDPNYVNNWIGQALIAETIGDEEAMDLFRHSVQLNHHQQGALGYGHWVCHTLLKAPEKTISYSIEGMHAIPVACDALTWYTEKNDDDGCAWNMLGILRERLKLNKGSLEAFQNAYKLSPKHRDSARINYGRLLYKYGKYIPAANIFQEVEEATFSSGSGLALALFQSQHYEESYAAYDQALHWLTEQQSHQSELLVALAAMAYMFQGVDGAKTLLFQSIQLKPPSPWGLYATLALGLLHKDLELADLVLKELEPMKDDKNCLPHYAILLCTKLIRQEKSDRAIKELSHLVHRHPDNAALWLNLAVTILRIKNERKRAPAAIKCAEIASKIGQASMNITKILGYVALGYILTGDLQNGLVSAQKTIFCYPNLIDGWALLASILIKEDRQPKSKIMKILEYIDKLKPSELIINWTKKFKM